MSFFKNWHIYIKRRNPQIKKMRNINIHIMSISNWRRNSHLNAGVFNIEGGIGV